MPSYVAAVAAATAIVGYDLFTDEVWARSPVDRILTGTGVTGSAVIGDAEVELFIDEVRVGSFFNNRLLLPTQDEIQDLEDLFIPAGAQLRSIVRDAPATSIIYHAVVVEDAEE